MESPYLDTMYTPFQ